MRRSVWRRSHSGVVLTALLFMSLAVVEYAVLGPDRAIVAWANDSPAGRTSPEQGCITGKKVDDLHVGLPGWTIHARPRDAEAPILTTTTDGTGDFFFAGLAGGWWTVWEEMRPGWAPETSPIFDVWVPPEPPCVDVRFKNRQACAVDPYEPDDTVAEAGLIQANAAPQKHTLEPPADLDWVMFDAIAGWFYVLQTDNLLGSTDTELILYDIDGVTELAYSDDIAPYIDVRSRINWRAPATGRYYARVRDYYESGARGCLAYDLVVTAQAHLYLPILVMPAPSESTPTPTITPTPSATRTPTRTPTPTLTPTPVPELPPIRIPGLSHPKGISVNPKSHRLFVTSRDTDQLYEVNPLLGTVVRTMAVGHQPFGVAVHSVLNKVYVANYASHDLTVSDGSTGAVRKVISFAPYGEPTYVAVNEATDRVYVPLHQGGRLAVINAVTDTLITTVEVGAGAFGVAVDPMLNRAYVSCRDIQLIRVVDGATNAIMWDQTAYPGGTPYALHIDVGLGRLYASFAADDGDPNQPRHVLVYRIVDTGPSLLGAVNVGWGGPNGGGGIAANPATHHVFVSNALDDSVTVFDGISLLPLDTIGVGDDPMGVAVDPGLSYVFVGNRGSNSVSGIPDDY